MPRASRATAGEGGPCLGMHPLLNHAGEKVLESEVERLQAQLRAPRDETDESLAVSMHDSVWYCAELHSNPTLTVCAIVADGA